MLYPINLIMGLRSSVMKSSMGTFKNNSQIIVVFLNIMTIRCLIGKRFPVKNLVMA